MQLNVTTDYAIRTVLYLAVKDELATANEIATAMGIPPSYVLKITRKLVAAGIIKRIVGAQGRLFAGQKANGDQSLRNHQWAGGHYKA